MSSYYGDDDDDYSSASSASRRARRTTNQHGRRHPELPAIVIPAAEDVGDGGPEPGSASVDGGAGSESFQETIEKCIDKIRDLMMSEAIGEFSDAEIELCSRIMDLKFSDDLELYTGNKEAYAQIDDERPLKEETKQKLKSLIDRMNKTVISPNLAKTLGLGDERKQLYGSLGEIKVLLMRSLNRNLKKVQEHRASRPALFKRNSVLDFDEKILQPTPEKDCAAVKLQAHWRGYLGRKVVRKLKTKRSYDADNVTGKYMFKSATYGCPKPPLSPTGGVGGGGGPTDVMCTTATEAFYASIRERMKNYTT